ncbi:MAG TPA: hypothetical protein VMA53_17095 [Stellaceae bacterium]|nr:hypothetical protein [Stellaceae bacterium]
MAAIDTTGPDRLGAPVKWTTDLSRFVTSPHCRDLFVIACAAIGLLVVFVTVHPSLDSGTVAAVVAGVFGVCAWAFQCANLRFGAADIFASEIVTLCRIFAVVDFIPHLVDSYKHEGERIRPNHSTQDYVVIFHNNSRDLEILDGAVVTWVTEFYVYFKALLDNLSRLPASENEGVYRAALRSTIYMAFLAVESGRQALARLVDDKSRRYEAVLTAMLSEIPAYLLLREAYAAAPPSDIRKQRIEGRLKPYQELMLTVKALAEAPVGVAPRSARIQELAAQVLNCWINGMAALTHPTQPTEPTSVASKAA